MKPVAFCNGRLFKSYEYDVPLVKANDNGCYKEILEVIRAMLSMALKTNDYLEFGVVTGCLRISKESIFTGLNSLVDHSITTDRFDGYIGFTEGVIAVVVRHQLF